MKGETKRVDGRNGSDTIAKREIGGNTYLVVVATRDERDHSHYVIVYGDTVHGDDHGMPDSTAGYKLRKMEYDDLASAKVGHNQKIAPVVSKAINRAVGKLTGHLEETKAQEDAVLGALEANADVHEGDE